MELHLNFFLTHEAVRFSEQSNPPTLFGVDGIWKKDLFQKAQISKIWMPKSLNTRHDLRKLKAPGETAGKKKHIGQKCYDVKIIVD